MTTFRRCRAGAALLGLALAVGMSAPLVGSTTAYAGPEPDHKLPTVTPTPQQMTRAGDDLAIPATVELVVGADTDDAARRLVERVLRDHGVERIEVTPRPSGQGDLAVLLGPAGRADIAAALDGTEVPDHAEGYALLVDEREGTDHVVLGGTDAAGQYYAAQTLRQLVATDDDEVIAGVRVTDYPAMPLRGTIEGFYGTPWTHAERLDQVAFYGDVKANTYIYAPKDDPYHRERWREPYPADKLAELTELVSAAADHHVRFTFALSPGNTICYTSEADVAALTAKFEQMYAAGVRAFNIPLDDIDYGRWHCDSDRARYGEPGAGPAGQAQADFLDRVQREFVETHPGTHPLQMVPTEYYNTVDSPYKEALRGMDEDIVVMWTGEGVVPPRVTVEQAQQADQVFGGPPFLWDNYPVNDYGNTAGRLLLAPYDKREAGLSEHLSGIVSNPMNQAAASKIAIFGFADFSWNDHAYDADRNWVEAMRYLSGGDHEATEALRVFADLNHLAPSFGAPWQPQAPALGARIEAFWQAWEASDRTRDRRAAVGELRAYARAIAAAPATIRGGEVDPGFVSDAEDWLDATELWAQALLRMLDALDARLQGHPERSDRLAAESDEYAERAQAVVVDPPDNAWGRARVRIADGVLDRYLFEAGLTLDLWEVGDVENLAPTGTATASSVEQDLDRLAAHHVNDGDASTRWASGYSDDEWVQVELPEPAQVRAVTVNWEAACATAYRVQTSVDGATWTTVEDVTESSCSTDVFTFEAGDPVRFVRIQGVKRKTTWGYSIWELGIYGS